MTTIHSNVTFENHADVLAQTEHQLHAATAKRDALKATFERRTAPKTDFDDDPATVSGIRRRTSGSMAQRLEKSQNLDFEAYHAYQAAEKHAVVLEHRVAKLRKTAPVAYTEKELRAATAVRTDDGWYTLLKVNAKTVGIEAGFPWPHKIARNRVLQVR